MDSFVESLSFGLPRLHESAVFNFVKTIAWRLSVYVCNDSTFLNSITIT